MAISLVSRPKELVKILANTRLRLMGRISQDELERRNAMVISGQEDLPLGIGAATEGPRE